VLRLRGSIARAAAWEVSVDLFFYRDPEELKALEDEKAAAAAQAGESAAFEAPAAEAHGYEHATGADAVADGGFGAPEGFDAAAAGWSGEPAADGGQWTASTAAVPGAEWSAQVTY